MAVESINREFEVFMREMMKAQECVKENIETELRSLIRTTVNSCATMYGFSAQEDLAKLDSNGNLLPQISKVPNDQILKEAEKVRLKEFEKTQKAEKLYLKEFKKNEKLQFKEFEKIEKNRRKDFEKAKKTEELSERNKMKEQDIASKAIEKAEKLIMKKKKPVTKKVKDSDCESLASTVLMTDSEDEEIHILFQNLPLIEELNSIRNVTKFKNLKKLSAGVKLARQVLDI